MILIAISCSQPTAKNFPFEYQMSQTELTEENKLDIYTYSEPFEKNLLIEFCKDRKSNWKSTGFYVIVIFDKKDFIEKTTSPISAAYGNQENAMKHIRAVYTTSGFNNYSKLVIYEPNQWDGKAESIDI